MNQEVDRNEPSIANLIAARQAELGLSDEAIGAALSYDPRVISLIKRGAMQLPVNKVIELADVLQVSRTKVIEQILRKQMPELWQLIRLMMPLGELTATEITLLKHLRKICRDRPASPIVLDGASIVALVSQS
jgi:hypothetical protein